MKWLSGWRWWWVDGLVAALAVAMVVLDSVAEASDAGRFDVVGCLLLAAGGAALVARRRAPRTVLSLAVVSLLAYAAQATPALVGSIPVLVAIYSAMRAGYRRFTLWVLGPVLFFVLVGGLTTGPVRPLRDQVAAAVLPIGWFVAAGVLGEVFRQYRAYLDQVEERAALAERTREEVALRRAGQERLRIARELHDSLTHAISVIKMQAGVAVHLAQKRGEEAPAALVAIQEASAEANRELRSTLQVLREGDDGVLGGLDRLKALLARLDGVGLVAGLEVLGEVRQLPLEVDRAAYRIVQEALTNVVRHSGVGSARVCLEYGAAELTVRVDDDGVARVDAPPAPGMGLLGLRERVGALGGQVSAAPRPDGGFAVVARLPVSVAA